MVKFFTSVILLINWNCILGQPSLIIKQRGKPADSIFIANYEDSCLKKLNDSTYKFSSKLSEPDYLFILLDRNVHPKWISRVWLKPETRNKELIVDYKKRNVIIKSPDEWDVITEKWRKVFEAWRKEGNDSIPYGYQSKADSIAAPYVIKNPGSYLSLWFLSHGLYHANKKKKIELFQKLYPSLAKYSDYKHIQADHNRKYPNAGDTFKEFKLPLENDSIFNSEKIKNKWVLMDFWSNGCVPCVKEMDEMVTFYKTVDTSKASFVSVSLDGTPSDWKKGKASNKIIWTSVWQPDEAYGELCLNYNIRSMPTFILFDSNKKIVFIKEGAGELQSIRDFFKEKKLLK